MLPPSVIFHQEFVEYHSPKKQSEEERFYRCRDSRNLVEYIDRDNAADKTPDEEMKRAQMLGTDTSEPERNILGYAGQRKGSTGLIPRTRGEEKQSIVRKLQKTKSIIWHSILSFTPEIGHKFCNSKADARRILEENLPTLFEGSHLDYSNIDWCASFHRNTDNPHIHLVFWEKNPTFLSRSPDGKLKKSFAKKGAFPAKNFENFRAKIAKNCADIKLDYFPLRDEIRSQTIAALRDNRALLNLFLQDSSDIIEGGKFQFARLDPEQQKKINRYVEVIVQNTPSIAAQYKNYTDRLQSTQQEYLHLYTANRITNIPKNVTHFYDSRKTELDSKLANTLLKELKNYAFSKNALTAAHQARSLEAGLTISPKASKAILAKQLVQSANECMLTFLSAAAPILVDETESVEMFRARMKKQGIGLINE